MDLQSMAVEIARQLDIDKKLPTALLSYDVPIPAYEFICMYVMIQIVHEMEPDKTGFYHCPVKLTRMLTGDYNRNKDYRRFNQAIDFLADTPIKWNVAREDRTVDAFRASFISTKRVNSKSGNPHFRINKDIEDLIKSTKVFSPMNLLMLAVFSHSRTAYPLYIHLYDALSRGADSVRLTFSQLKVLFGVKEDEYVDNFKDFNKKHIKPKCAFIVSNSDLTFEYRNFRVGRKVGGVDFIGLRKQEWQQVLFSKDDKHEIIEDIIALAREIDSTLKLNRSERSSDQYIRKLLSSQSGGDEELEKIFARYKKYGVSKGVLKKLAGNDLVGKRGLVEILEQCEADIKKRAKTQNPIRDDSKHVFWAINSGWKDEGYGLKSHQERQEEDERKEKLSVRRDSERKRLLSAVKYFWERQEYEARSKILTEELKERAIESENAVEILAEFSATLENQFSIKDVENSGFETRLAKESLGKFLAKYYDVDFPLWDAESLKEEFSLYEALKNNPAYSGNLEKACNLKKAKPNLTLEEVVNAILPELT